VTGLGEHFAEVLGLGVDVRSALAGGRDHGLAAPERRHDAHQPGQAGDGYPGPGSDHAAGRQQPGLGDRERAVGVAADQEGGHPALLGLLPKVATE
jgi:hypothetical protein